MFEQTKALLAKIDASAAPAAGSSIDCGGSGTAMRAQQATGIVELQSRSTNDPSPPTASPSLVASSVDQPRHEVACTASMMRLPDTLPSEADTLSDLTQANVLGGRPTSGNTAVCATSVVEHMRLAGYWMLHDRLMRRSPAAPLKVDEVNPTSWKAFSA